MEASCPGPASMAPSIPKALVKTPGRHFQEQQQPAHSHSSTSRAPSRILLTGLFLLQIDSLVLILVHIEITRSKSHHFSFIIAREWPIQVYASFNISS